MLQREESQETKQARLAIEQSKVKMCFIVWIKFLW
jgi:hypothetical protein